MFNLKKVVLSYNIEDELLLSSGHKLRGFFANQFEDVLFHHHLKDGSVKYQYPLIQYKIVNHKPVIVGLGEGAKLIIEKFLEIDYLKIGDKVYRHPEGHLKIENEELVVEDILPMPKYKYTFLSPWLGLNQNNYHKYVRDIKKRNSRKEKISFFEGIMVGNILSFAKAVGWWVEDDIIAVPNLCEVPVKFKNQKMIGFKGVFYSNVRIPEMIGLGKSCSRGFGTLKREDII